MHPGWCSSLQNQHTEQNTPEGELCIPLTVVEGYRVLLLRHTRRLVQMQDCYHQVLHRFLGSKVQKLRQDVIFGDTVTNTQSR